ncbi:hypothetical protein ERX46_16745 [Brumimicrobium glaciale]|uniref:WG repeat-containing protein n=1 Tax=Brumimicrobium glaciale TaxID=200475 RepID=A0A4Q4KF90_9FLAO|nr:hypothetical protein [Brumimicrobium glaciale]RYM31330.1 hypothetical protein ERX46_16745 [Brumimicrobium glaciale]
MKFIAFFSLLLMAFNSSTQPWQPRSVCPNSPFFIMMNEDGKQGVIDADSNIVIQPKYKSAFIDREPIIDSTGYASGMNGNLAILIDENGQTGVNLNSLEKSPLHRNMAIIKNHFYYHDSTHWGIYDSNFDLVVENMTGQPMV